MKTRSFSLSLITVWLSIFCFIPMLLVSITSFLTQDPVKLATLPFTLNNYAFLVSPLFLHVFMRSIGIAALTTLGCFILAYPFCYAISQSKYRSMCLLLLVIPFWTSSLVRTYAMIAILKFNGFLNAVLLKLHLIESPLQLLYTNFAVLSGLIYDLFPFMALPIFISMERFDFKLIEAAKDLGATRWTILWRILLPNTLHGVLSGCLMTFLPAMTLFYIPDVLGGAKSVLLGNMIQQQFLVLEQWPEGAATSVFLTLTLLSFLFVMRRFNHEK